MDEELAEVLVALIVQPAIVGALLYFDRKRLDAYGRDRMWNDATLGAAVNPLVFPWPVLAFGAHVWVTRRGPWWTRLGKALLGVLVAGFSAVVAMNAVLFGLDAVFGVSH
jgi:hypothetical protein